MNEADCHAVAEDATVEGCGSHAIGYEARATLDPETNRRLRDMLRPLIEAGEAQPWYWRWMGIAARKRWMARRGIEPPD